MFPLFQISTHREAMKKISEIHIKDHFQTRKSPSTRGFNGGLSSKSLSSSWIFHEQAPKDTRRVKRVRFTDPDTVYQYNCKPDASSIPSKGTQSKKFDDPKTSEYAFYKRLRVGTERNFHFHNQDGQLKKVEASNCSGVVDHLAKYRCEDVRPLLPVMVTPTELRSSLCLGEASKNQVTVTIPSKHLEAPHNSHEEIFPRKRRKLCQWVAETSSLDVDEISSKGYDVVSVLLQRLVPQSNASKRCMPPSSRYKGLTTRSQLIASSNSDTHFGEHPWTPTPSMHFIEPTSGLCLDDDTSECRSNKYGVVTSLQWDTVNSETLSTRNEDIFDSQWGILDSDSLSTRNADRFDLQYRKVQPYCASDDENATDLHTKMKPCWFTDMEKDSLKRNGSLPPDQVLSTKSQLIASSDSDMHFEELPWTPTPSMHFIEPTAGQHLDDDKSERQSNKSGVITSSQWDSTNYATLSTRNTDKFDSQWDILNSDSLSTRNADIFDVQYRKVQPYCASDDENATVLQTEMKPCWFTDMDRDSLKRNGSLLQDQVPIPSKLEYSLQNSFSSLWDSPNFGPSDNLSFPALDEFHKKKEFAIGIEHLTQFLDHNDGDSCNSVVKASPIRTILLRDDHEQCLRKFDAIGLDSLPFPAIHHSASMNSLLDFWSERFHNQAIGRSFEENNCSVAMMNGLPLTFSCYQSYLSQGCRLLGNYRGNGLFNCPHTRHSFTSQVFREKLCPNVDTLVQPSGLDSDFGCKSLLMNDSLGEHQSSVSPNCRFNGMQTQDVSSPILTEEQSKWSVDDSSETEMGSHFAEEIFNVHDSSSSNFRISLKRESALSLLFDKSSSGWM
ncbi:uncharacterized protein LOC122069841 isoform X2 [Macadamia integrifolia]|uniref:uncharacterized protein LOC122069841 isoform X2 n=1 Tax=Macadamia integrifolia TaxID=60698 RepID=UPI001C5026A5|nr:uncharacterized protein LOC122069841 isoform X2 [Macadamia integrifolia]